MSLPDYIPKLFKKGQNSTTWYNGNQQSTYELCAYVQRHLNKDGAWLDVLYTTVKNNSDKFGVYAGLNNWSHQFTDSQLTDFINLVNTLNCDNEYILK
jgi:hypothetical protein